MIGVCCGEIEVGISRVQNMVYRLYSLEGKPPNTGCLPVAPNPVWHRGGAGPYEMIQGNRIFIARGRIQSLWTFIGDRGLGRHKCAVARGSWLMIDDAMVNQVP